MSASQKSIDTLKWSQRLFKNREKVYPALKYKFLTPFYDYVVQVFMPEHRIRNRFLTLCGISDGTVLLDFGCGTGSMLALIRTHYKFINLTGYDPDPQILKQSIKRLHNSTVKLSTSLDDCVKEGPFDIITTTWVFHHLTDTQKEEALLTFKNNLKPGGVFIIADWGKPANLLMSLCSFFIQLIDNFHTTASNFDGLLPEIILKAGFQISEEAPSINTSFGTIYFYKCLPL